MKIPKATAVEQSLLGCGTWNQKAEQKLWVLGEILLQLLGPEAGGGVLLCFYELSRVGGSWPGLRLRLGCSLPVSPGREPQAIVAKSPTRRGQLIQLSARWRMCGQSLSRKRAKQRKELALLKSPVFGSSRMALINCSRLLIGWEGEMVGGGENDRNKSRARACARNTHTHTHNKRSHTPASKSFFRKGARRATP